MKSAGLLGFAVRHPLISAGGVGTVKVLSDAAKDARKTEAQLITEQLGGEGSKYAELDEFLGRKRYLHEKIAFVKNADFGESVVSGFGGGIGGGAAKAGIQAIGNLIGGVTHKIHERLFLDRKRRDLLDEITANDFVVSTFERESPGSAEKAYSTLAKVAPTLSMDPNVVTSFLRNAAQSGGPLDFQTVKLLADAEKSLKQSQGLVRGGSDR